MPRVAVIGCGLIGRAWTISFLRGSCEVTLWDRDADAPERLRALLPETFATLRDNGLLDEETDSLMNRLKQSPSLSGAIADTDHVQENTPEILESKRALFAELDATAPPDAVLASSTSGLLPSAMFDGLAGRDRCVVAHPINPPYLVPAVEIVPAPFTRTEVVEKTAG